MWGSAAIGMRRINCVRSAKIWRKISSLTAAAAIELLESGERIKSVFEGLELSPTIPI